MKINIKKSNLLNGYVAGIHAGALLIVLSLPVGPGVRIGLAIAVVASVWWQGRFACLAVPAVLELLADGSCSICSQHIRQTPGGHIVGAAIHSGFIRLMVKVPGRRSRVLLVMEDAVEPEVYRELRAAIVQGRLLQRDQAAA